MSTGHWIALGCFVLAGAWLGALVALGRLEDRPYEMPEFLPIDEFFGELLEDADVQEMQAKRERGEHRSFLEQQRDDR